MKDTLSFILASIVDKPDEVAVSEEVDENPYGGGVGMVLRVDVLDNALQSIKNTALQKKEELSVLLDARGQVFTQSIAKKISSIKHVILICGHYEGFDERIRSLVDMTI